jgi:hypothetical protein
MRYSTTRLGHLELVITDEPDWSEFERLAGAIRAEFDAPIVERIDGPDERYWDLEVGDQTVTLHLQHYLGICLYAPSAEDESLVRRIGLFLESRTR